MTDQQVSADEDWLLRGQENAECMKNSTAQWIVAAKQRKSVAARSPEVVAVRLLLLAGTEMWMESS